MQQDNFIPNLIAGEKENLNLNSLLVTRQMTLFHQGVRMGGGGGGGGGGISPLNARVKRTWTHSHQTFQQRRQVNQGGHSSP